MNSSEFIKHVKDSIVNSERVTFEIENFPATLDQEGKKSLLDMVYRTIKSPKSSEDQKRVALKIFKQCLIVPKNTDLINMFIKCQMWDIFMAQFREFKRNPSSERLSGYSTGYFLILEDFLEGCKDVLGVDSLNNETPFSKFWNAVISPDPNPGFTRLVSLVAAMQGRDPRSVGSVSAELGRRDGGYQLAGFVNSFLEEHPLAKRLQAGEALSEYEILLVKAQFFNFAEEEFFFGFADPKAYGVLSEVVELEAQREIGRADPRQLQTTLQKIEAEPIKRFTRNWNLAQNDLPHPQSAPLRPQTVGVSPLESRAPEAAVSTPMTPAEHARNMSRFNQVQPSILPGVSNYSVRSATSEEVAMMQREKLKAKAQPQVQSLPQPDQNILRALQPQNLAQSLFKPQPQPIVQALAAVPNPQPVASVLNPPSFVASIAGPLNASNPPALGFSQTIHPTPGVRAGTPAFIAPEASARILLPAQTAPKPAGPTGLGFAMSQPNGSSGFLVPPEPRVLQTPGPFATEPRRLDVVMNSGANLGIGLAPRALAGLETEVSLPAEPQGFAVGSQEPQGYAANRLGTSGSQGPQGLQGPVSNRAGPSGSLGYLGGYQEPHGFTPISQGYVDDPIDPQGYVDTPIGLQGYVDEPIGPPGYVDEPVDPQAFIARSQQSQGFINDPQGFPPRSQNSRGFITDRGEPQRFPALSSRPPEQVEDSHNSIERIMANFNNNQDRPITDFQGSESRLFDGRLAPSRSRIRHFSALLPEDLKRLKVFAFLKQQKLFGNESLKVGMQTKLKAEPLEEHRLIVSCFWEKLSYDVGSVKISPMFNDRCIESRSANNVTTFEVSDYFRSNDYPWLEVAYSLNGAKLNESLSLLIPITKFLKSVKNQPEIMSLLRSSDFPKIESARYALHREFFKSLNEIKFVLSGLESVPGRNSAHGIFNAININEPFLLEVNLEQSLFFIRIVFANDHLREKLDAIVSELVLLFAHPNSFY